MTQPAPRFALIATFRNEATTLLPWIAHHKAVGFDAMVLVSNDCADGTDALLDRLEEMGELRHVANGARFVPFNIRLSAYARARVYPEIANATWAMTLDADECLVIRQGDHTLPALVDALPGEVEAIAVARRLFSGWPAGRPVWESPIGLAERGAPPGDRSNRLKMLVRDHTRFPIFGRFGPLLPDETPAAARFPVPAVLADGTPLPAEAVTARDGLTDLPRNATGWEAAQINHYAAPSADHFLLKCRRGNAASAEARNRRVPTGGAFRTRHRGGTRDRSIDALAPAREAWLAKVRADPMLRYIEERAASHAADVLARLRAEPGYRRRRLVLSRLGRYLPGFAIPRDMRPVEDG